MLHEFKEEDQLLAAIGENNFAWVQRQTINHLMKSFVTGKVKPTKGYTGLMFRLGVARMLWMEIDWICTVYRRQPGFDVGFHAILLADKKEDFYADAVLDRYNALLKHLKTDKDYVFNNIENVIK